mmetsp:Transcript_49255/g.117184  ORF Transcript_49255/g.117184 Transcript_49255/m.117184 type:complete len:206 (-) Transcript_49255:533-1150(-)
MTSYFRLQGSRSWCQWCWGCLPPVECRQAAGVGKTQNQTVQELCKTLLLAGEQRQGPAAGMEGVLDTAVHYWQRLLLELLAARNRCLRMALALAGTASQAASMYPQHLLALAQQCLPQVHACMASCKPVHLRCQAGCRASQHSSPEALRRWSSACPRPWPGTADILGFAKQGQLHRWQRCVLTSALSRAAQPRLRQQPPRPGHLE